MSITPRLTANDIARQSLQSANFIEELRYFKQVEKKRERKIRFLRELGWWALVVAAPLLAAYAILRGGR